MTEDDDATFARVHRPCRTFEIDRITCSTRLLETIIGFRPGGILWSNHSCVNPNAFRILLNRVPFNEPIGTEENRTFPFPYHPTAHIDFRRAGVSQNTKDVRNEEKRNTFEAAIYDRVSPSRRPDVRTQARRNRGTRNERRTSRRFSWTNEMHVHAWDGLDVRQHRRRRR